MAGIVQFLRSHGSVFWLSSLSLFVLILVSKFQAHPIESFGANALESRSAGPDLTRLQTFAAKPRVLILSDILNEPDDSQSLVRYLLYSNEFDTRGIIACTSTWLRNVTHAEEIERIINIYGTVVANLNYHVNPMSQYPEAGDLVNLISTGPEVYGIAALEQPLSDGARMLIDRLQESEQPLYITCWGGVNTIAQALQYIQQTMPADAANVLLSRIRMYSISDQDDTGSWIRRNFPGVFYIASVHAWSMYTPATWRGISADFGDAVSSTKVENPWLKANVQLGPLGAAYPSVVYIMEGDSPTFLYLIQNGLSNPERPDWGSWGGRYGLTNPEGPEHHYADIADQVIGADGEAQLTNHATIWRWRDAYQNDFAARIRWTMTSNFSAVGHPPVVTINGSMGLEVMSLPVKQNQTVVLDASATYDPDHPEDNNQLSFEWFQYWEPNPAIPFGSSGLTIEPLSPPAGTNGTLSSNDSGFQNVTLGSRVRVTTPFLGYVPLIPELHMILQVTSRAADYPLRRYKRIVFQLV